MCFQISKNHKPFLTGFVKHRANQLQKLTCIRMLSVLSLIVLSLEYCSTCKSQIYCFCLFVIWFPLFAFVFPRNRFIHDLLRNFVVGLRNKIFCYQTMLLTDSQSYVCCKKKYQFQWWYNDSQFVINFTAESYFRHLMNALIILSERSSPSKHFIS